MRATREIGVRRWALLPLAMVAIVAAGCQPPPPPISPSPPQIVSLVVPEQVTAGTTFELSVTALDDKKVTALSIGFTQPSGTGFEFVECRWGDATGPFFQVVDPQPVVTAELSCDLPYAPDGTWTVGVRAGDADGVDPTGMSSASAQFQVTGGSTDLDPPVLESVTVSPDPLITGSRFDVTVRVSDAHPPVPTPPKGTMSYVGNHINSYGRPCYEPTLRQVSETVHEWVFPCQANTDGLSGTYTGHFGVYDSSGNRLDASFDFAMAPKP